MLSVHLSKQSEIVVTGGDELQEWRERLAKPVPGHKFTPQFKAGHWDGMYRPGRSLGWNGGQLSLALGRGMLRRVMHDFEGQTEFSFSCSTPTKLQLVGVPDRLYDHQQEALELAMQASWGRFALATNAGKGAVIALLAKAASVVGENVLILSDEVAVVDALCGEIRNWVEFEPAIVQAGVKTIPWQAVTVAMVPTLSRRINEKKHPNSKILSDEALKWREWLASIQMVLVDEADKATSTSWTKLLGCLTGTTRRYGFSGTFPEKDSIPDLQLEELLGPVLMKVKNAELIEKEISARPTVILHPFSVPPPRVHWKEWKELSAPTRRQMIYENAVILHKGRHALIRSLLKPDSRNAIIVNRIEHGEQLAEFLEGSVFLDGSVTPAQRIKALERFEAGEFNTLIVTKIMDRGSNRLGLVDNIIFASAEGSNRQTLQRIGRGLRRTDGKGEVVLHDIVDNGHHYLKTLASKRLKLYNDEGFEVRISK